MPLSHSILWSLFLKRLYTIVPPSLRHARPGLPLIPDYWPALSAPLETSLGGRPRATRNPMNSSRCNDSTRCSATTAIPWHRWPNCHRESLFSRHLHPNTTPKHYRAYQIAPMGYIVWNRKSRSGMLRIQSIEINVRIISAEELRSICTTGILPFIRSRQAEAITPQHFYVVLLTTHWFTYRLNLVALVQAMFLAEPVAKHDRILPANLLHRMLVSNVIFKRVGSLPIVGLIFGFCHELLE